MTDARPQWDLAALTTAALTAQPPTVVELVHALHACATLVHVAHEADIPALRADAADTARVLLGDLVRRLPPPQEG